MYIPQFSLQKLNPSSKKVTVIYGPRRVGKTTLLKEYLKNQHNYLYVTGEDIFVQKSFSSCSIDRLKEVIGHKELLVIDEAQYIPSIGINLKLIVDQIENVRVIVTGSSAFGLTQEIGEPLTGRQKILQMFPVAQLELSPLETPQQTEALLESRLIYGSYPEVLVLQDLLEKQTYLQELVSSYLLKDILAFEGLKKSKKLFDLLTLLAFQIGKEVSHHELAKSLSIHKGTIERYLELLEQSFILFNIRGFSRNLRKEVTKTSRYYFYDNGIRNALINNYNSFQFRDDLGLLWENYLVTERIKKQHYLSLWSHNYFWRTYDQKEIDWVEERSGKLYGYEFKWGCKSPPAPKLWMETYQNATFEVINPKNYLPFIT